MPYPAKAVANKFLDLATRDGQQLTSMKLLKLVYFAHGWCLALTGRPLVREAIEAWKFGPVVADLYHYFKRFGSEPITEKAVELRFLADGRMLPHVPTLDTFPDDEERRIAIQIIERVWQVYGRYSAVRLSNATHMPGTPWEQVYKEGDRHSAIPDQKLKEYFQHIANGQLTSA